MIIKSLLLPIILLCSFFSSAQNEWKELDLKKFQWKNDQSSKFEIRQVDERIQPILNSDGSFVIPGLNKNYVFDNQADYKEETLQEITDVVQKTVKRAVNDLPQFVRKGNVIASIEHYQLFYSVSGEVHAVDLEKVISYNNKGEEYDKVSSDSRGIISITEDEIIFYQHYFSMSEQTHPGIKPVRGVPYSFMRIGRCNLKNGQISFEYLFVDYFDKNKKIPVGEHPERKVYFIGMKGNHAVFGFTHCTRALLSVRTGVDLETIKVPENIVGYYTISAVDLKSYDENELIVEEIKKPADAFVLELFPMNYGFALNWSKRYDRTIFESRADLIEVNEDLSISKTNLVFPVEDLPMKSGIPVYLPKVKLLDGSDWYALNARFVNSKKRQDIKEQDPVIIMINKEKEIQYRNNSFLEWSLVSDAVQESKTNEECLPCLADLKKEAFDFFKEVPDNPVLKELEQKNNTFFVRNGNSIRYVQVLIAYKTSLRTGEHIIKNVYVRTGMLSL